MERHISDTHTVHWEKYYVHLQPCRTVFMNTLCRRQQAARPGQCSHLQRLKSADKHI